MKNFTMVLALMMLFVMPCVAEQVQPERARSVAQAFLNSNRAETNNLVDVSAEAGFPNLYIFTAEHSFVVMSANDCVQPVLGYSLTGSFGVENMPSNVRDWLQGYNDQIQEMISNHMVATDAIRMQWSGLQEGGQDVLRTTTVVAPLIQTQWDQTEPYNNLCPSGSVTGCVATVMAQIMKYWNYPSHGIGWHSYTPSTHPEYGELTANFNSTNYNWNNMTNTYGSSSTSTQQLAVATLMYQCGVSVNMDYSPSGSGAGSPLNALRDYFNYSSDMQYLFRTDYTDNEWITMLKADLNQNRPIYYSGHGSGGHAFICDGYDNSNYFHFNWGWGGNCDGYFSIDGMNPAPGYDYNENHQVITGIRPSANNANPSNLTYTQNERNVTLNWSSASGATSYNIYRDMGLVGNVTTTSFTEIAPYGNSIYYVRSVNSAGELSLSTNSVSVTVAYPIPLVDDLSASVAGDDVSLSWTAPEWCYPATPSATLTYGSGIYEGWVGYSGSANMYWGHRYPAASLSNYANMIMYNVSFYANEPGAYQLFVYQGTISEHPQTQVLQQSFSVGMEGWYDIELSNTLQINPSQDLWVFIYDPVARIFPGTYCTYSGNDANYYSTSPTSWVGTWDNSAFLIRTCLTDGTYTYNIYRNGSSIANHVSSTSYNDNDLPNGSYTYYVKTNYYAGETAASNSVTAQVNLTWCTISTSCDPTNGGTASGGGSYYNGQNCTLTATPAPNYTFTNWTENGNVVSTNASYTFTVNANRTLVAHFTYVPPTYTITVSANPSNGGNVTGGGTFQQGQSCTVSATPAANYTFTNWTENGNVVSTNASYTFTVNANRTLVAHFTYVPPTYTITVSANPSNGGNVTGGGTIQQGQSCTVVATPNVNYTFNNWTENGNVVSTNASYTFTVNANRTLVAHFTYVPPTYTITVSVNPTNGGNVTGGGTYQEGQSCTVHATANTGYNFVNWTANGVQASTSADYTFTVTGNLNLVAHFSASNYIITALADPEEGGSVSGSGGFNYGDQCTLTATANRGYTFVNWTKNGAQVSTNASYTFTVTESATYIAHFQAQSYTITVLADPTAGGTVTGDGTFTYGQSCTVHATANTGHNFVNWTENGTQVSTDADYTFTVTGDRNLVAHFDIVTFMINATTDPDNGGSIIGIGSYDYGQTCTMSIEPYENYTFIHWTENGVVVSEEQSFSFTVEESHSFVAHLSYYDGVDENHAMSIDIYPTPVTNTLTVKTSQPVNKWEVFSALGTKLYSLDECADMIELPVRHLAPGIYMIRMTTNNTVFTRKFVKK